MQNKTKILLSFVSTSLLYQSLGANELDKITVTDRVDEKRKYIEESFYQPYSKSVILDTTINEEGFVDIGDALRDIPGISIKENGSYNKEIRMRGFSGPRITTLENGMKLDNQGMSRSGAGEVGSIEITNVKRIEVIKGSPAVVYDPGAAGGVVNVITNKASDIDGFHFKQRFSYSQSTEQKKSTTDVGAGNGRFGAKVSYTKTDSDDYNIVGDDGKEFALSQYNDLNNESENVIKVDDFGYHTKSLTTDLNAKIGDNGDLDFSWNDWNGKDMTLVYGDTIESANIIRYNKKTKDTKRLSYIHREIGNFDNIQANISKINQYQKIGIYGSGVTLNTEQATLKSEYIQGDLLMTFGAEAKDNDAKTLVYSTDEYRAAFLNNEYAFEKFTLFAGARYNSWTTTQRLLDGANADVAEQLVGISGVTPSVTKKAPTYSVGGQYLIDGSNNISLNMSRTYRSPDLMERYSFSNIIGGGVDLLPEDGKNYELAWKYLDEETFITSSIFVGDFKNYIWTKNIRRLVDQAGLEACIKAGDCDPTKGDYNDRENDFFESYTKYYNVEELKNWGMEFEYKYTALQDEFTFLTSFAQVSSDDKNAESVEQPLDTTIGYRHEFKSSWKPWVKIKVQHVANYPKVEYYQGFSPYTLYHLTTGFEKYGFKGNLGVNNVLNTEYNVPYSGINGFARSLFFNLTYEFK